MSKEQKKYWFNEKCYGWGWGAPASWQGWVVMIVYALVVLAASIFMLDDAPEDQWSAELGYYLGLVTVASLVLIFIAYKKGPKPRWRWGSKQETKKSSDRA